MNNKDANELLSMLAKLLRGEAELPEPTKGCNCPGCTILHQVKSGELSKRDGLQMLQEISGLITFFEKMQGRFTSEVKEQAEELAKWLHKNNFEQSAKDIRRFLTLNDEIVKMNDTFCREGKPERHGEDEESVPSPRFNVAG